MRVLERVGTAVAALFESANMSEEQRERVRQGTIVSRGQKLQIALKFDLNSLEILHQ